MPRYITINGNNKIIATRFGPNIAEGEIESERGELGQILQADGSFLNDSTPPLPQGPTIEEKVSELKIQSTQTSTDLMNFMDFYFANQPV